MVDLLIEDHKELREMVRRVAVERVSKRADDIDRLGEYPHDMFELLRELELFTLPFDKKIWWHRQHLGRLYCDRRIRKDLL